MLIGDIEKEILTELETGGVSRMEKEDILNSLKEKGVDVSKLAARTNNLWKDNNKNLVKHELMDENFQKY